MHNQWTTKHLTANSQLNTTETNCPDDLTSLYGNLVAMTTTTKDTSTFPVIIVDRLKNGILGEVTIDLSDPSSGITQAASNLLVHLSQSVSHSMCVCLSLSLCVSLTHSPLSLSLPPFLHPLSLSHTHTYIHTHTRTHT